VQFSGPYVNFYLNTSAVGALVLGEIQKKGAAFGASKTGHRRNIIIEYPSNNTHKEFHIGHVRNVCIGNTLVRLYAKSGYRPVPVNYLNDFGAHVVRCLWGLRKFHAGEAPPDNKQKWLGDIYAEASAYAKAHPEESKPELDALQAKLESRDKEIWGLFMETRQWSIDGIERLFGELAVTHRATIYEKDIKARGQEIVDALLKSGIATVGDGGAVIVDLSPYKLDIALIRKSTGAGLYITSDLALAEKKFKKFRNAVESIHITGAEQNFYFDQLFKVLELFGFKEKMTHIGYGLVNTPEGKMSSRAGNVILYETLRDAVTDAIGRETRARHTDWPEEKIAHTVRVLAQASLKFTIQKHEAGKNIVFDINEATSFDGFTAPYVLYAVARVNSIVRKAGDAAQGAGEGLSAPEEKKLILLLAEYADAIPKALAQYNPSVIAKYCFDLAQAFNEFYNKHRVLEAEDSVKASRLALCRAVRTVLADALGLLTIETVEEM
jgi:arginyl-tRNA synthetase